MNATTTTQPTVIGYVISDASGEYDPTRTYPDYASALRDLSEISAGETIGAVLSDGSVTFEVEGGL